MTILSAVADWLTGCPLLDGQRININYLGYAPLEYAVIEAPVTPILTRYLDGSSQRQKAFAITAVQDYSPDYLQQLAAAGVWAELTDWIDAQNDADELPELGEGRSVCEVAVTATHAVIQSTAQTARYQIQIALTYDQDADAPEESEE